MVWATIYAQKREYGKSVAESVRLAALEVKNLRSMDAHRDLLSGDDDAQEMLADMLGVKR
jgi:hypothetical protein